MYSKSEQLKGSNKRSRTAINKKANAKLSKLWKNKGINYCEICGSNTGLTNMHRHKRVWYYDKPDDLLWSYEQTIRSCLKCHMKLEHDREGTSNVFESLR